MSHLPHYQSVKLRLLTHFT